MKRRVAALPFAGLLATGILTASACGSTAETVVDLTGPTPVRCQPTLAAGSASFGPSGGTGTVAVTVARECEWTASSSASWIALTEGRSGQGEGTIAYRISENADPTSRRGSITVLEQSVQIGQEPAPCVFTVTASRTTAPASGGDLSISVRTHAACTWTASANASWASILPPAGTGDGLVRVQVAPNSGGARTADVIVAGQHVRVSQEALDTPSPPPPQPPSGPQPPAPGPAPPPPEACSYDLSTTSASFEARGGPGLVRLRTSATCLWTAISTASWLTIAGVPSGAGEMEITYVVAENFSPMPRSATLNIASAVLRVTQSGAEEIRLDGKISALAGVCPDLRFTVKNTVVTTNRDTEFRKGDCSDARNGRDVVVRGYRQADGTVDVRRVDF